MGNVQKYQAVHLNDSDCDGGNDSAQYCDGVEIRCLQAEEKARQFAEQLDLTGIVLSVLTEDERRTLVKLLFTQRLWSSIGKVLNRNVSDSLSTEILHECLSLGDRSVFSEHILPNCNNDQLDLFMAHLVTTEQWRCVTELLAIVPNERSKWTVGKTQVDSRLIRLVAEGDGWSVDVSPSVSDSQRRWLIDVAYECANDEDIIQSILPYCDDDLLESMLTTLVALGLWRSVDRVLKRGVGAALHKWALCEACRQADDWDIVMYILQHFVDDQLDEVWTTLVTRGLWDSANTVFFTFISPSQRSWAVRLACEMGDDHDISRYVLSLCDKTQLQNILSILVTRCLWRSVGKALELGVRPDQKWLAIQESCQQGDDQMITEHILPLCDREQREEVVPTLVTRGLWKSVGNLLKMGVRLERHWWVIEEAAKTGNDLVLVWCLRPPGHSVNDLKLMSPDERNRLALQHFACGILCTWAEHENTLPADAAVCRYATNRHWNIRDLRGLTTSLRQSRQDCGKELSHRLGWDTPLCAVLCEAFVHFLIETWVSGQGQGIESANSEVCERARLLIAQIQREIDERGVTISRLSPVIRELCSRNVIGSERENILFRFLVIKNLIQLCYKSRQGTDRTDVFLSILTCFPVLRDVQCLALTVMQHAKRWNIIRLVDLCGVWEQVRRRLLTAALKQRRWSVVAQWANYTLYDDQCVDALEEAYTHKQWRVYLWLADHGPTEVELMRVHYRLTRYAPWNIVLEMFERGADMIECQEGVRPGKNLRILDQKKDDNERRPRYVKLLLLAKKWETRMGELQSLEAALERREWSVALYEINRRHRRHEIVLALKAALMNRVWHVAIYLIRQGIGTRLCDRLFSLMLRRRQWDLCRVLLEEGVDPQLGLAALPQLMEQNQWTLVARLMEYDLDDALRRQVMQRALDRREGSVVWQCIINMEHDHLSVEERQELFHEAFNRENWQAVKPLVEVKDNTGIQHRDDALLESIEQHQWDVVDHCLLFRANINMLDEDNHTPMHRMARKDDWEAVEELTKRGGDPNLLDKDGMSVFHRVIRARQWELVKMQIQYHGDIHQRACYDKYGSSLLWRDRETRTPLQMLIDARQIELIEHTFMWSPDLWKGVNDVGETTLHVACLLGCPSILYYLLARRVDVLTITRRGHSALAYAVMCAGREQETLGECIRLGFSTHQQLLTNIAMGRDNDYAFIRHSGHIDTDQITRHMRMLHEKNTFHRNIAATAQHRADSATDATDSDDTDSVDSDDEVKDEISNFTLRSAKRIKSTRRLLASPLLLAVMRGLPVVTQMLYESGACSYRELFMLRASLQDLALREVEGEFEEVFQTTLEDIYAHPAQFPPYDGSHGPRLGNEKPDRQLVQQCACYLLEVSSTPRSLQSMCRQVISCQLKLHKRRVEDVARLPLPPPMKRYVKFADLTGPDNENDDCSHSDEDDDDESEYDDYIDSGEDGDE